ncbi:uncharacterized protein FFB20_00882 [Fusarium fujikuroi]|nr:uncharacterized protein Y057_5268 [Fusarium fujikuroi]QGI71048.1 hypothetical protein CEK27_003377 [Fusarium fujikuroi]QGJ01941.1 hypothetical protein CEK26_003385 [Fusarium fujikuroi]SCN64665.1 uncharacterized protein FFB20_00882 [Fusarium fujikuroi]SCV54776.1 uncharacterized protein FFFS_11433 [Fusarium fujikuroi]
MPIATPLHRANTQKTPIAKSLTILTNTLCTISEQRCYDHDAQRRALAGIDICRKFRFAELALRERATKRRDRIVLLDHKQNPPDTLREVSVYEPEIPTTIDRYRITMASLLRSECGASQSPYHPVTEMRILATLFPYSTPKNFLEQLGNLVAACPNVTEFTYGGLWYINDRFWPGTLEQVARFSQQYAKFAKQLCHLEICGSIDCIQKILMYDYPNLSSFTINVDDYSKECKYFEELSSRTPSLERLELYWFEEANLQDLNIGFKAWGKTLQSLAMNPPITKYTDRLLGHLLPHLTNLEDLYLGPQPGFQLSDLHAIAQPGAPRLKSFQWRVNDTIFWDFCANSETVNQAIIDIFLAYSETLNSFIIDEELGF